MGSKKSNGREVRAKLDREAAEQKNRDALIAVLTWFVPDDKIFADLKLHGNVNWKPSQLVLQAICWSWQETKNITDAFEYTVEVCDELKVTRGANTYPAFMNALQKYRDGLKACLDHRFHSLAEQVGGRFYRIGKWVLIGFDGSRISTPRSLANEKAFCARHYGEGTTAKYRHKANKGERPTSEEKDKPEDPKPQIWITLFWHMGLNIPWTWRLGPSDSSERGHVMEILEEEEMPEDTLFCGDAGFVGYGFWSAIIASGGHFLVRVGGNVHLLCDEYDIEHKGNKIVWCWPKGQRKPGSQPLKLRLLQVKVGKTKMWMLTSVLSSKELSAKQIIKYYQMRWGIEVEFRGLKQTLDNGKIQCRNSERALVELDWSIRGMAIAKLLALREQIKTAEEEESTDYTPTDLSLSNTIRALRHAMRNAHQTPKENASLLLKLACALVQGYNNGTDKKARYRPQNPDKKPLGDPKVRKPTPKEKAQIEAHEKIDQTAA
jgi:hypothetical protein